MARSYAPLMTSIWSDEDFVTLTPAAQRMYLLALSQPNITYCGVVPFTARRWARMGAGTTTADVEEAVAELVAAGFLVLDEDTEELWVRSFVRHNGVLSQPQLAKAMDRAFDDILSPTIRSLFLDSLPPDLPKGCVTLREALGQGASSPPEAPGLEDHDLNLEPEPSDDDAPVSSSSGSDPDREVWLAYAELVADAQADPPTNRKAFITKVARTAQRERGRRLDALRGVAPDASAESFARWLFDDIDPLVLEDDWTPAADLKVVG